MREIIYKTTCSLHYVALAIQYNKYMNKCKQFVSARCTADISPENSIYVEEKEKKKKLLIKIRSSSFGGDEVRSKTSVKEMRDIVLYM